MTESPLDLGVASPLCIAVDPADAHGVRWWHPGRSGCTSRASDMMQGEQATVSPRQPSTTIDARFRLGLHALPGSPEFADVQLVLEASTMRAPQSRFVVPTIRRDDLDLPELPGAPPRRER